jgi:hypothetical protein
MLRNTLTLASITTAFACVAGCGQGTPATDAASASPPAWQLAQAPSDAIGVADAKASATEGETIAVRGIIGGTVKPLSSDSPTFRIVDTGLFNVCTADDDHCPTPWDYCCATQDDVRANSATIQIVDASGAAVTDDLTANGLEPLDEIIVVGTVAPRPDEQILIVRATGVFTVR